VHGRQHCVIPCMWHGSSEMGSREVLLCTTYPLIVYVGPTSYGLLYHNDILTIYTEIKYWRRSVQRFDERE